LNDIDNWDNEMKIKLPKPELCDMELLLKDIEFIGGCGEKCEGPLCIYPDLDSDEELPTLVRIDRNNYVEIISYGDLDHESSLEKEIEKKMKNLQKASNIKNRHERSLRKLKDLVIPP
jgi:hypothetical protein